MTLKFPKIILFSLIATLGLSGPALTAKPDSIIPVERSEKDLETIKKVEESLNAIHSLRASFVQRAPDGTVAEGMVYLERPGKLRFDYGKDAPFLVVSNGTLLTFVDYEVKQVNRWPIKKTPLGILVDKEIKLDSSVEIPDIIRFAGLIKIPVIDPKRRDYGYIILIFEESTMELRAWESVDAQGYTTRVALVNPEYNVAIDKKRFTFKDPRPKRHGPRRR
ncbi:MAG: outer membrane lipoprotein carrier protein LolA [Alphaproteobacteria bacterium]|nr:outer membrane lipoprotein carrier protein LolA [Alphaproteobacteria bacterium]